MANSGAANIQNLMCCMWKEVLADTQCLGAAESTAMVAAAVDVDVDVAAGVGA